jgi:hypothetical protein
VEDVVERATTQKLAAEGRFELGRGGISRPDASGRHAQLLYARVRLAGTR